MKEHTNFLRIRSTIQRIVEGTIRKEINKALRQTHFSCNERRCRYSALRYHGSMTAFECTLKKVCVGVDNNGHWCDMFEEGMPEWSRLKDKE